MNPDDPRELLIRHRRYLARRGGMPFPLSAAQDHPHTPEARPSRELMAAVECDLAWLAQPGHHLVTMADDDYPDQLAETRDPPPVLFAAGNRAALAQLPRVAIVGARKASRYGMKQAAIIAETLARHDVTVISGLATGIDAAAHEGALAGGGITVAVLGNGCDEIYPRRNWRLAERIVSNGLVMSELPTRMPALPRNFPRRNRIVTGLCAVTLVVEAAERSGSLVSARLALDEGREVMAVPGLVTNPQARGCHRLIREGALLIESAQDVLDELGLGESETVSLRMGSGPALSPDQEAILGCLDGEPLSLDLIAAQLDLDVESLSVNLVMLEVLGFVVSEGGRYVISPG